MKQFFTRCLLVFSLCLAALISPVNPNQQAYDYFLKFGVGTNGQGFLKLFEGFKAGLDSVRSGDTTQLKKINAALNGMKQLEIHLKGQSKKKAQILIAHAQKRLNSHSPRSSSTSTAKAQTTKKSAIHTARSSATKQALTNRSTLSQKPTTTSRQASAPRQSSVVETPHRDRAAKPSRPTDSTRAEIPENTTGAHASELKATLAYLRTQASEASEAAQKALRTHRDASISKSTKVATYTKIIDDLNKLSGTIDVYKTMQAIQLLRTTIEPNIRKKLRLDTTRPTPEVRPASPARRPSTAAVAPQPSIARSLAPRKKASVRAPQAPEKRELVVRDRPQAFKRSFDVPRLKTSPQTPSPKNVSWKKGEQRTGHDGAPHDTARSVYEYGFTEVAQPKPKRSHTSHHRDHEPSKSALKKRR